MFIYMAEYCDTLQSKERRSWEYKVYLNEGTLLCPLDHNIIFRSLKGGSTYKGMESPGSTSDQLDFITKWNWHVTG